MKRLSEIFTSNKLDDEKMRKYQLSIEEIINNKKAFELLQESDTLTDEAKKKWKSVIQNKEKALETELRKDMNSFDVIWSYIIDQEERISKLEEQMDDLWRI